MVTIILQLSTGSEMSWPSLAGWDQTRRSKIWVEKWQGSVTQELVLDMGKPKDHKIWEHNPVAGSGLASESF